MKNSFGSMRLVRSFGSHLLIVGLVGFASISTAHAATVYLKDGSELHGTVVSATAQNIQLFTPDGTLTISTDRIVRVDYSENGSQPSQARPPAPPAPAPQPEAQPQPVPRRVYRRRAPPPYQEAYEKPDYENLDQKFDLEFGFVAPLSKLDLTSSGAGSATNGDGGALLGVQYLNKISSRLDAGFNLEYFNRSSNDTSSLLPTYDASVSGDTLLLLGVLKYYMTDRGGPRPYILAGLGTDRNSTVVDAVPIPGNAWPGSDPPTDETRRLIDDSSWGLASTLRFGMDFPSWDPSFLNFEIGWTGLFNGRVSPTSDGENLGLSSAPGNLHALTITGRWGWKF